ncbi:MAG: acyl-CoA dehydratase activase-related protein [Bacillota bacterium]
MGRKVGIPRALLYYYYFPLWQAFFRALGAKVAVSGPSTKSVLNRGVELAVEDACLPVKLALGHVAELAGKVDYLFLPRLVSVASREYICPKFLGFPDMVRQAVPDLPPIIDVNVNLYRRQNELYAAFRAAGKILSAGEARIFLAYRRGLAALGKYWKLLGEGFLPEEAINLLNGSGPRCPQSANAARTIPEDGPAAGSGKAPRPEGEKPVVAVIGHPYNIYDPYISMNLLKKLRQAGVKAATAEQVPETVARREAADLPKRLFWTLNQRMTGAAFYFLRSGRVQGLLQVTSFGCGPDSMTGELIARRAASHGDMPFLNLVLDEHSGEAGVLTRLEAFLDMVRQKQEGGRPG